MSETGTEPGTKVHTAEKSNKADNVYKGHKGIRGFRSRLISLTRKEIRQLLRDRSNLVIGIGLPFILILIFGYGLSLDVRNATVAVVLEDPS
ncbi:MAG: hypothetical protein ABI167_11670, partial [Nitrosospira sp.]